MRQPQRDGQAHSNEGGLVFRFRVRSTPRHVLSGLRNRKDARELVFLVVVFGFEVRIRVRRQNAECRASKNP